MDESRILKSNVLSAIIISLGFICSSLIVASSLYRIKRMDNILTVTGSAKVKASSDQCRWVLSISRIAPVLGDGYNLMNRDLTLLKEFLVKSGVKEDEIEVSQIITNQPWLYTERSDRLYYQFSQEIFVTSKDLDKIEILSKKIYDLVNQGVSVVSNNIEYYYSGLPELRVTLLNEAMQDARRRADVIARSTGRRVGKLKSARMGVVQVMAPGSIEISDYGTYNTRTREKEIMVTVQATFYLR